SQAQIDITAFPSPSAGRSTGSFALYDSATSLPIPIPVGGFTDFGDGNAALFPAVLTNNYQTIRVEYTYKDNDSPCSGSNVFFIRIAPTPTASFDIESIYSRHAPEPDDYCEGIETEFDATASSAGSGGSITYYEWN